VHNTVKDSSLSDSLQSFVSLSFLCLIFVLLLAYCSRNVMFSLVATIFTALVVSYVLMHQDYINFLMDILLKANKTRVIYIKILPIISCENDFPDCHNKFLASLPCLYDTFCNFGETRAQIDHDSSKIFPLDHFVGFNIWIGLWSGIDLSC